ncbi:TonB family protein [Hymenobacter lutimineralis]|uniref:TonB family protein n=1 Tax=Hymenobacter lutimineralis TaxID=2606448 RepID=A0A5D6V8M7_9BACT|nr:MULTISPECIES: energy transducer TonB [Hymenobacter]QIX62831.1 TonB family protein [Hymenobacter sp. BT18]TYZ11014.1 TonB family protein [Hymenobacter lutimineralis]
MKQLLLTFLLSTTIFAARAQQPSPLALVTPATEPGSAAARPAAPKVYVLAEEMPAFKGGEKALLLFMREKVQYPAEALQQNISGKVYVRFVVDEQGRIRDAEVVKGLGHGLDQEALRLVRIMPWWTPGRVQGQPVRVYYTLPVAFRTVD